MLMLMSEIHVYTWYSALHLRVMYPSRGVASGVSAYCLLSSKYLLLLDTVSGRTMYTEP
jgi:hypothetical protein